MRQLIDAVRHCLRNLLRFSGRDRRGTFWRYVLVLYVAHMALSMLVMVPVMISTIGRAGREPPTAMFETFFLFAAISGALFVAMLAAAVVRRLHDTGRSGLWGLMPVPFLTIGIAAFARMGSSFHSGENSLDANFPLLMANNFAYLAVLGLLIYLLARPGSRGPNRFGPDPREADASGA